jgi:hypothetical protein
MSLFNPFGSKSSSNKTTQTDARTVSDYSGATVGSTINIYGADADLMSKFLGGNQSASPFASNAEANGMRGDGLAGAVGGVSPLVLLGLGGVVLLAVLMRR